MGSTGRAMLPRRARHAGQGLHREFPAAVRGGQRARHPADVPRPDRGAAGGRAPPPDPAGGGPPPPPRPAAPVPAAVDVFPALPPPRRPPAPPPPDSPWRELPPTPVR